MIASANTPSELRLGSGVPDETRQNRFKPSMRRAGKADENFEDDCRNGQYRRQAGYDGRQKHVTRIFLHCARQRFLGFGHLEPGIHSALNLSRTRRLLRFDLALGRILALGQLFNFRVDQWTTQFY